MIALLRAELLKLRTTRTFVVLTGVAVAISLLLVGLTTWLSEDWTESDVRDLFAADFSSLFILLLGVMGMAGEWRHRTITSTILAAPDRVLLVAAKLLAYAAAGVVVSLAVTVSIMAVGTLILEVGDKPTVGIGDLADVLWRNLTVAALLGAFGVVVGGLVRNQIVAIVSLLVIAFALEPTLVGLAPDVGRFFPTVGLPSGIQGVDPLGEDDMLAPGIAVLVMLGWVGLGFAGAALLLRRRDLVE